MKVPFAVPEYDPQITQITRINSRKKAHNTQNKNTYKANPSEIRSAVVNEFHRARVVGGEVAEDLFDPQITQITQINIRRLRRLHGL